MGRIGLLAFAAGAAALALEMVWMRWFRLLLGATAPATSATLVAFFGGQALGAVWGARRADRHPLRRASAVSAAAALTALGVVPLLGLAESIGGRFYDAWVGRPALLTAGRFGLAALVALPAAFCLGALLPLLAQAFIGPARRLGRRGALVYALFTLGSTLGALATTFFAIERLGVRASYGIALVTLVAVAGAAWHWSRGQPAGPTAAAPAPPEGSAPSRARGQAPIVLLAAFSGFAFLALEVLLVQALAQIVNGSRVAFGAVLATVLAALAVGGAIVGAGERTARFEPRTVLGIALTATALAVAVFPAWFWHHSDGLTYLGAEPGTPYAWAVIAATLITAGPALLLAALVFPLSLSLAARRMGGEESAGGRFGVLLAANTAGAIAGALAAPYLLLEHAGLWGSFAGLAILYAVAALAVPDATPRRRWRRDLALAGGWIVVLTRASPLAVPETRLEAGEALLHAETTAAGVVAVVRRGDGVALRVDNHYVVGGTADRIHEERQGHLPLLLHPRARRVAYVGAATGISAGATLLHPIDELVAVEIVPGLVEAARRFLGDANHGIYDDPRTRIVLDDARNFFRSTARRFDVVIADLFVPWRAGVGSLYTREHFEAVRRRLAPDGLFCQWLPLYQLSRREFDMLAATFLDAFPRAALFRGDFYGRFPIVALVGWSGEPPAPAAVARAAARLAEAGVEDRWVSDPLGVFALYAAPLEGGAFASVPRNSDDRPRLEQLASESHRGGRSGRTDALIGPHWIERLRSLRAASRRGRTSLSIGRDAAARRASAGGFALQEAGALFVAGRREQAAQRLAEAARLLPAHLLLDAAPDPTAAELWHELRGAAGGTH